jgi:hypothetical protein
MKLTYEDNKGKKITVEFSKQAITDTEVQLDKHIALEPLWEALKNKLQTSESYI